MANGCQAVGQVPSSLIGWAAGVIGIPCAVVSAQINDESGGNPQAVSPTGAQGVAQFEPGTWQSTGCSGSPFNVNDAMKCYAKLMYELVTQYHGNVRNALAAYNAGPGHIAAGYGYADSILAQAGQPGGLAASGGSGAAGTEAAAAASSGGGTGSPCLIGIKGVSVPVLGSLGQACFLSKSEARAMLGGLLLVGSAFGALVGLLILAAAGFRQTGAAHAAGGALEGTGAAIAFVPGLEGAGLAVGAAGATARRAGSSGAGRRSLDRRQARRTQAASEAARTQRQEIAAGNRQARQAAGAPAQQRRAVSGRAPIRRPAPARQARAPEVAH